MSRLAFLIDFGSTFTKVTAVDLDRSRIVGRSQAPSTVLTDVRDGLLEALNRLNERHAFFPRRPAHLDALAAHTVLASSSAAGGLKLAVIGLVPGLTVEAAKTAALGAGAKLTGSWSFKLSEQAIAEIEGLGPDIILLTGGTDGGDSATLLHNARLLARAALAVPLIIAGNRVASGEAAVLLRAGGKEVRLAENVLPAAGRLSVESAREEIRKLFMERITQAKGLDKLRGIVPVVLPTPMAVLQGALLGARGSGEEDGWGDMLVVDVGGATTDVHSIGEGRPTGPHIAERGLPEAYAKRTVEGDLGIRFNAVALTERIGFERFEREFRGAFPRLAVPKGAIIDYIKGLGVDTSRTPVDAWQNAVDAQLARAAVDFAVERHAGKRERIVAREGEAWMHYGKDLSDIRVLIGTGGVFTYNPYAAHVLSGTRAGNGRYEVLRPRSAARFIDSSYLLYAVGLLAEKRPDVALQIFKKNMMPVAISESGKENRIR
jgi:uncharacterized protein (TIGR01319 family)